MDPLVIILPELHDMMFQHFTAEDFVKTTEVSPSWNGSVSQSAVMMKKVKLDLRDMLGIQFVDNRRCIRGFRNLSVRFDSFYLKYQYWYLTALSPLIELELCYVNELSQPVKKAICEIDLSRLKKLKLAVVCPSVIDAFLRGCSSLISLELLKIEFSAFEEPIVPNFKVFLEQNKSLQEISFYGDRILELFFENDITETTRVELKSLLICDNGLENSFSYQSERNFYKFLKQQSSSLECFRVNYCSFEVLEHVLSQMPALTSLAIYCEARTQNTKLYLNEKITDLYLGVIDYRDFKKIIPMLPKVRRLRVHELCILERNIIKDNLLELETLQFCECQTFHDKPIWTDLWPHAVLKTFKHFNEINT